MRLRLPVLAFGLLLVMSAVGLLVGAGDDPAAAAPGDDEGPVLTTRRYDVGHLLVTPGDYRFAFLMDMLEPSCCSYGGNLSLFGDSSCDSCESCGGGESKAVEALRDLIERTVRAEEPWESMGGRATLDFYEKYGMMMASTTEKGHQELSRVLDGLAAERAVTVMTTIEAVELDEKFVVDLYARGRFVARTDAEKQALSAAVKRTFVRTSLSGSSGQALSSNSGTPTSFIRDQEPVISDAVGTFDPEVSTMPNGLAVLVRPTLISNSGRLMLDYALCYARERAMRQMEHHVHMVGKQTRTTIDLPTFDCDQRAGTVALSLGCPTIIGGGTVPASLLSGEAEDKGTVELYYIATVRIIETEKKD